MRRIAATSTALFLLASGLRADCTERVIEWVKEPGKTTKTVREDGVLVYRNTWIKDASGKSTELGPGALAPGASKSPPAPPPAPPTPVKVPSSRAREVALSLEGTPYRAGGTDPRLGVNTPGLAYAFFSRMGLRVSTEMTALFRAGSFVSKTDVQPGDLVFHHSSGSANPLPNMVGVALGNQEIVYLSGSRRKVIRTRYDTPWWEARYKGARRLLGTASAMPATPASPAAASTKVFEGVASFYGCGDGFDGSGTSSGERFDASKLTAAHFDLPFGTMVEVTNLANGKQTQVRINDRGPFERQDGKWVRHSTRVIDVSCRAADDLGFRSAGLTRVRCRVVN